MRLRNFFVLVLVFVLPLLAVSAYADQLGPALIPFAVLGGSAVTNASGTGNPTIITGSLGVSPGTSCTGFFTCDLGPGLVLSGTTQINTGPAAAAQGNLTTAILNLNALGGVSQLGWEV